MTGALAVVLAALAAGLLAGGAPNPLTLRLGSVPSPRGSTAMPAASGRPDRSAPEAPFTRATPQRLLLAAVTGAVAGALVAPGAAVLGALVPPGALVVWSRRRSDTARRQRENDVADACLALASQLRAGSSPEQAMASMATEWPDLFGSAAGRVAVGGEPTVALRTQATGPGAEPLATVASAWDVSSRTGAPLASTLTAVADSLRAQTTVRHEAEAQLATVRTTSRLLAALPVGTLLLFSPGGGAPVEFLLVHPYGVACLVGAMVFIGAGLAWVERVSRTAMRTPWTA